MKNFTIKKKLLVPVIATLLILVTALTGCLGSYTISTGGWNYADDTGKSITLSGSVSLLDNPDNWREGFVWDTVYHDNYSEYANKEYATDYGGFGTFYLTIHVDRDKEYHYRAFGLSLLGNTDSQGSDKSFVAGIPFCRSDDALDITLNSCNFTGELTHLGGAESCDVWFEYGLSEDVLDSDTPIEVMEETGGFYAVVSSLTSCTTYYYRAVVENDVDIAYGLIESVEIGVPQVSTKFASDVGSYTATLNGELELLAGASSCEVWFAYGDKSAGNLDQETPHQTLTEEGDFFALITGLEPATTYWFAAHSDNGECSDVGSVFDFTTADTIGGENSGNDDVIDNRVSLKIMIYNRISKFIDEDTLSELLKNYPFLQRFLQ